MALTAAARFAGDAVNVALLPPPEDRSKVRLAGASSSGLVAAAAGSTKVSALAGEGPSVERGREGGVAAAAAVVVAVGSSAAALGRAAEGGGAEVVGERGGGGHGVVEGGGGVRRGAVVREGADRTRCQRKKIG